MAAEKIIPFEAAVKIAGMLRACSMRVVLAPGCFDVLHVGHLRHLRQARTHGDILIISLTPDSYVGKGPTRPINPEAYRAEMLADLEIVDYVFLNQWPDQGETIRHIRPAVFVVGNEYRQAGTDLLTNQNEREACLATGAEIAFTDDRVTSSTKIIQRMSGDEA